MAKTREEIVASVIEGWLVTDDTQSLASLENAVVEDIVYLCEISQSSYREVLLTVLIGRLMDPSYKAGVDFYASHPRPIFEGGIRPILEMHRIPCTQSGPLNVAKATTRLDENWASQRRPADAGRAVVRLVSRIDKMDSDSLNQVGRAIAELLIVQAHDLSTLEATVTDISSPEVIFGIATKLISDFPNGGNTPQRIAGLAMEVIVGTENVYGTRDSASTTNATSGKPGDLGITNATGEPMTVFEVTVKKFDMQRISACTQSITKYNHNFDENDARCLRSVNVLCRREDVAIEATFVTAVRDAAWIATLTHKEISYTFVSLEGWLVAQILNMNAEQRGAYFEGMKEYVNEVRTPRAIKSAFLSLVGDFTVNNAETAGDLSLERFE